MGATVHSRRKEREPIVHIISIASQDQPAALTACGQRRKTYQPAQATDGTAVTQTQSASGSCWQTNEEPASGSPNPNNLKWKSPSKLSCCRTALFPHTAQHCDTVHSIRQIPSSSSVYLTGKAESDTVRRDQTLSSSSAHLTGIAKCRHWSKQSATVRQQCILRGTARTTLWGQPSLAVPRAGERPTTQIAHSEDQSQPTTQKAHGAILSQQACRVGPSLHTVR